MSLPFPELGEAWRAARPAARVVHFDHAACSRQSLRVLDVVAAHARLEAEVGGYQAEAAAAPALDAGRAAIASLLGTGEGSVAFVEGARAGLFALLARWPFAAGDAVACAPGEYGPNLSAFARSGLRVKFVPTDDAGHVDIDALPRWLAGHHPAFMHLTHVPSQRGIVHAVAEVGRICRDVEVPLVLDVAQALGQVATDFDADAAYGTSRKWLAGPRGVGFVAVRSTAFEQLRVLDGDDYGSGPPIGRLESSDAHIAGRIGLSLAVSEFLAAGTESVYARLAAIGSLSREVLGGIGGWRVIEPIDEPTAVATLIPPDGVSVVESAGKILAAQGILTTAVDVSRAPGEMTEPVLRISGHLETTVEQIEGLARALAG
jgi:pyridoxal 5-phosphate dependent beta-lyase